MKKGLLVCILCLFITACGENKLTCIKIIKDDKYSEEKEYDFKFNTKGDKLESYRITTNTIYKTDQVDELGDKTAAAVADCENKSKQITTGLICDVSHANTTVTKKETYTINELPYEVKKQQEDEFKSRIEVMELFDTDKYEGFSCR